MTLRNVFSQLILVLTLHTAFAFAASAEDIPERYPSCTVCHGQNADGKQAMDAPRLAGQNNTYLIRQLQSFKKKTRGYHPADLRGSEMSAIASPLSELSIERLASYISTLRPVYTRAHLTGNIQQGKVFYQENCRDCHGYDAAGLEHLKSPNLKILSARYHKRQIKQYSEGWRGDEFKADIYAKWMRSMAGHFSEESDADNVIAYIHSLR